MGFFKKVKKAVKKVTKSVSKVVKPVAKAVVPLAGQVASAYAGNYLGGLVESGLNSITGNGSLNNPSFNQDIGKAVGQGVANTFNQFTNSIAGNSSQYGGVSMPQYYSGSTGSGGATSPTPEYSAPNYTGASNVIPGFVGSAVKTPEEQGADTRKYLAAAYPEMNPWERSGTGGTMFGSDMTSNVISEEGKKREVESAQYMQSQLLAKDLALAQLASDTQILINSQNNDTALRAAYLNSQTNLTTAGIASQTSRLNTSDQVALGYRNSQIQQDRLNADIQKIAADTSLSEQSRKESIAREIKSYAETNNIKLSAGQIQAMTAQAYQQVAESRSRQGLIGEQTGTEHLRQDNVRQQTENLRYGQGPVMGSVNSAGNFITDGIDSIKAYWNDMWSNSGGVTGAMSRK